ncbi:MAG: LysR family transcriptional regulator [Planctomycetes bacterium]|nr:LysR family transcriptional regulator [Planctomycetota bacterium]
MIPDPESLHCFLEAARRLNFRAAAQAVHLTPAALGKRIARLEAQLGASLFQRTTRSVALTEAGLALIPNAERALESLAACGRAARGETGPPLQEIVLGTRQELALSWVLPMLRSLEQRLSFLRLSLYLGSGPDLELRVRSGEVDCAVSSKHTDDPRLDGFRLHEERYVFVGHPKLLASEPFDDPADAEAHTLIDVHRELSLYGYWKRAPDGVPLNFASTRIMGAISAIRWCVVRKYGVAVLPRYLVTPDLEAGRLVEILPDVQPLSDHFRLIFRADDPRRSLFEALADEMRAHPLK